jgi:hypothetical protein
VLTKVANYRLQATHKSASRCLFLSGFWCGAFARDLAAPLG